VNSKAPDSTPTAETRSRTRETVPTTDTGRDPCPGIQQALAETPAARGRSAIPESALQAATVPDEGPSAAARACEDARLGYFAYQKQGATYTAALVVVSAEGDPLDFAHTDPVALNRFSLQLLGARADGYMVARVLLEPLLRQVATPAVVCFDDAQVLQRRLVLDQPAIVFAARDAPHKDSHWAFQTLGAARSSEAFWISRGTEPSVVRRLQHVATAMAPFGLREPFVQLRAAMSELVREPAR
jgi:hypothetical protein